MQDQNATRWPVLGVDPAHARYLREMFHMLRRDTLRDVAEGLGHDHPAALREAEAMRRIVAGIDVNGAVVADPEVEALLRHSAASHATDAEYLRMIAELEGLDHLVAQLSVEAAR